MKGYWKGEPVRDIKTGNWEITFEVSEPPEAYDKTSGKDLEITVKEYREKRSLNANSYFYVLCGKLANLNHTSLTEVHNLMLARYGQIDKDAEAIIMADDIEWQKLESLHLRPTGHRKVLDNGKVYQVYLIMKGSHTYNTKEMSNLIDGVVSECKLVGIETLTPSELERIEKSWKAS